MSTPYHIPALLTETLEGLHIRPEGVYVDATFGGGGHSRAMYGQLSPQGQLFSFDRDPDALAQAQTTCPDLFAAEQPRFTFVHSDFRYLSQWMDYYHISAIDGLLADLGVSFHHFDTAERGFSFRFQGPLDMRMNRGGGKTAADIVNTYSEEDLARVFYQYGELSQARPLARRIVKARQQQPVLRTEQLAAIALGENTLDIDTLAPLRKKTLTLLFQSLRIEVNDELGALRELLLSATQLLRKGGRIAILTYHSLEDRLVKNFFRAGNLEGEVQKDFYGNILTPFRIIEKGRTATPEEVQSNPRARSAKLRVAEKL